MAVPSKQRCKVNKVHWTAFSKSKEQSDAGNQKNEKKYMRKIVQKNEFSIMILSARRGPECRILHHLSQSFWGPQIPGRKGRGSINLPATFQFSPATSKSIDIPELPRYIFICIHKRDKCVCSQGSSQNVSFFHLVQTTHPLQMKV